MATSGITSMSSLERGTCKITINGVTYASVEAYKKAKKAEEKAAEKALIEAAKAEGKEVPTKKKKRKKKTEVKEISAVALQIQKMMTPITTLKSFAAYYDHAYRQWGTIAKEILEHRKIRPHFVFCRVSISELEGLMADIEKMSKKNEKAAYQYVEKVAWKLDDIKTHITNIMKGAVESGYLEAYKKHECINGKGRRLGLQTLINKSLKAISQMEDTIGTLKKIADNGTDPFSVGDHMSAKTRARCWA